MQAQLKILRDELEQSHEKNSKLQSQLTELYSTSMESNSATLAAQDKLEAELSRSAAAEGTVRETIGIVEVQFQHY